jgi:hypothetical protein
MRPKYCVACGEYARTEPDPVWPCLECGHGPPEEDDEFVQAFDAQTGAAVDAPEGEPIPCPDCGNMMSCDRGYQQCLTCQMVSRVDAASDAAQEGNV